MKLRNRLISSISALAMLLSPSTLGYTTVIAVGDEIESELPKPQIRVNIPDGWLNSVEPWTVEYESNVTVYYEVSDEALSEPEEMPIDLPEWNNGEGVSDGNAFIRFWAVFNDAEESLPNYIDAHYMLDRTTPSEFSLKGVISDRDSSKVTITNIAPIVESGSGIREVYYTLNGNEGAKQVINDYSFEDNTLNFSFNIDNFINESFANVYVVDNVSNVQTATINVNEVKDISAPKITVNIPQGQWVNNTDGWITAAEGAAIYYEVSESEFEEAGNMPIDVAEWKNGANVPEGKHYIRFWAVYPDEERIKSVSHSHQYQLDRTAPSKFSLSEPEEVQINPYHRILKVSNNKSISDKHSGIKEIFYTINEQPNTSFEQLNKRYDNIEKITNEDESVDFKITFYENLDDATIRVYVLDNAGNITDATLNDLSIETQSPKVKGISVVKSDKNSVLNAYTRWDSIANKNVKYIFANEESYLKLVIEDDFESPITIFISLNGKELELEADKYYDPNRGEIGVYYIPLPELGFTTKKSYTIECYALDGTESEDNEHTIVELDSPIYYATSNYDIASSFTNEFLLEANDNDEHAIELNNKYDALFKETEDSIISFEVSDDIGIIEYQVEIDGIVTTSADLSKGELTVVTVTSTVAKTDEEGNIVTDEDGKTVTETVTSTVNKYLSVTKKTVAISLNDYPLNDGEHTVKLIIKNSVGETYDKTVSILVDTTVPVINGNSFESINIESQASLLKYLSFGIFGSEQITIKIDATDTSSDIAASGIKSVVLNWAGKTFTADQKGERYEFTGLQPNNNGIPSITLTDYFGNTTTYHLVSPIKNGQENSSAGELTLESGKVSLMLEDKKPNVRITLPECVYSVAKDENNTELWYAGDISYQVEAWDNDSNNTTEFYSGLNEINIKLNKEGGEHPVYEFNETGINNTAFTVEKFNGTAVFENNNTSNDHYLVKGEGHFEISAEASDNAFNVSDKDVRTVHIDSTAPEIVSFVFGDSVSVDNDSLHQYDSYEIKPYGYYFKETTLLKVVVTDPNTSSGLKVVKLWLDGVDGSNSDSAIKPVEHLNGESFCIFEIKPKFKGRVIAEVIDNVGHSSGQISANGDIVEDEILHEDVSSLIVNEDVGTDRQDANSIPLYNRSIPLTITANDSFSGIARIEWEIVNDGKQGAINIDNSKAITQEGAEVVSYEVLSEDNNLITSLKCAIVVESNTNSNVVNVKLIDRSGNTSEITKHYSIDTTAPTITASFGNNNVQNGSYYKDAQTVNIAITERNFNGSDVQVKLNGAVQSVTWDDAGATVGQDSTVHNASFTISADGDYTYEITYTDRAGNDATPVTSAQFTIDLTDPKADISFNIGDDNLKDAYYNEDRTVTFNINEHNYSTATIHITKDGQDVSGNYDLSNWNPKDHSGDNHNQSVTLSENGYYVVSINVTDKSGRTVSEQSNGFYIDKDAPVVNVRVSNVANGAPSNAAEITPVVSVEDIEGNLDSETITLSVTAIKLDANNEIVPDIQKFIGLDEWKKSMIGNVVVDDERNPNAITFTFNNLGDDGIYTFEVTASDKAGNTGGASQEDKNNGAKYKISVNRLGSTYEVDEKIAEVDPSLRYFRNKEDTLFSFTITEYNVNQLKSNDSIVKMTCDGNVVENNVVATEDTGSDKWSKYTYEFPSELMDNSGKYIVKLYSVDEAGNENPLAVDGQDERATVTFFIDNDDPTVAFRDADDKTEFSNNSNYRTDSKRIEVEVYDNSQQEVKNVTFKLDGEDITADVQHEAGTMVYTLSLPSKSSAQNLSVSLEDIAGNHIETGVEGFLITTNLFVLWFSNTPLFIASIVVFLLAIAGIVLLVIKKKNKRRRGF